MTKIEQVARAMWEQRRKWSAEKYGLALEEWGDGSIPRSNGIMEEAQAALEAMREPTKAMLDVVDRYEGEDAHLYTRMIDAALAE